MKTNRGARKRELGFSLVETLVALALTGMLLTALAAVTGQWLPSWRHGFAGMQRLEALEVAIERLSADIAAAKPITANRTHAPPLFTGGPNAIVFVREAIGPNAGARLEWVRVAELENGLVRSRAPYAPVADDAAQPTFADPVELEPVAGQLAQKARDVPAEARLVRDAPDEPHAIAERPSREARRTDEVDDVAIPGLVDERKLAQAYLHVSAGARVACVERDPHGSRIDVVREVLLVAAREVLVGHLLVGAHLVDHGTVDEGCEGGGRPP